MVHGSNRRRRLSPLRLGLLRAFALKVLEIKGLIPFPPRPAAVEKMFKKSSKKD